MRSPRRDINVFNLSMMDVIASALGAFLILFIVTMHRTEAAKEQAAVSQAAFDTCAIELKDCRMEPCATRCPCDRECPCAIHCPCPNVDCSKQCPCKDNCPCDANCPCDQYCACPNPSPPFVAILIRWEASPTSPIDIDLMVTDPQGGHCNFETRRGCQGELVKDYREVGVTEVFLAPRVPLDNSWWTVDYVFWSGASATRVNGTVYFPEGQHELPALTLGPRDVQRPHFAFKFKVDSNRRIQFEHR